MKSIKTLLGIAGLSLLACSTTQEVAQPVSSNLNPETEIERPIPYPVTLPYIQQLAIENGTRTGEGSPGEKYWTQWSEYDFDLTLNTNDKRLDGESSIKYYNNSPDTLNVVVFELAQNVHKEGVVRNEAVEITGGINLTKVSVEGISLNEVNTNQPGYYVQGTNLVVLLPALLFPDDSMTFEIDWNFKIPQRGAGERMGYIRDNLFYLAYYYPHVAVYDDLEGWFADPFTSNAEFYHGFGDYKINITAPEQWIVMSSGEFLNPDEVLDATVLERYNKAGTTTEIVNIVTADELGSATKSGNDGMLTWSFEAKNVRDVAFSATKESFWDGTITPVGDRDGDGEGDYSRINSFWRAEAPYWKDEAEFAAHSIKFLSEYTQTPYPWPHMTSVEGAEIIGGGMEFPMMTIMGDYNNRGSRALYDVTAHELAHMWMPMIVSTNERRFAWMDEGSTTYHEANARWDIYPESKNRISEFNGYLWIAGSDYEGEIMRRSDFHYNGSAYGVASYSKPGSGLIALQGILGEELFYEAWITYIKNWAYKHPTPYDLFNTFNTVSGQNLDYFWRGYYFETWVLDQAIEGVAQNENEATITISDNGDLILPVLLTVTYDDGSETTHRIEADAWLSGSRTASIDIITKKGISEVVIDKDNYFPDRDRRNNIWRN